MSSADLIDATAEHVRKILSEESSGHDWWHIYRVWQLAQRIGRSEPGADTLVVELGALLHDIADWKFNDGSAEAGPQAATEWLTSQQADPEIIDQVVYIVRHISFKGGTNEHVMQSLEGKIVQDADRLDAIGAIGVARTFAFGGHAGRPLHDPKEQPMTYANFEEFKKSLKGGTTVNHFYEKLLLLKDGMHTAAAKRLAEHRHAFMETYLEEFYDEWEGKR